MNKSLILILSIGMLIGTAGNPLFAAQSERAKRAVEPFDLQAVRLLDGPFREAMLRDQKYLLALEPDRFLFNFRQNVGLESSARPYGGWDRPSSEQRGAMLGHYLTACSQMYASTGNAELKRRVDYIVARLVECQSNAVKSGFHSGYLAAFPESFIDRVEQGRKVWVPWYAVHKIMAGLLDADQHCANAQALQVLTNMANWVQFRVQRLPVEQMQKMLNVEHGGMNEVLANLYAVTGNTNYLALAQAFNHQKVLAPLAKGVDNLNGLHANTQIPKVIGVTRQYELTSDPEYLTMAKTFWDAVALHRSYVIGGHSDREHFFPKDDFANHLSPDTCETCNTYNMLKLTRELFSVEPSAAKMDFYERGLFNHILASQDPQTGMFVYLMSLKPGHFKTYSTPEDSFWCCVGTGMENHSKYGETIYYHDADSLYVNLFIASELSWPQKQLVLRQETAFPESDRTVLRIKAAKPATWTLKIRHPGWAVSGMSVVLNGQQQPGSLAPGSYYTLSREWQDGDQIELRFPMTLHAEALPGTTNLLAFLYGPIVLAGELGTNGMPVPFAKQQREFNNLPTPSAPVLVGTAEQCLRQIVPVEGKPLTFRTRELGQPKDVTLIPFYRMHRQRYTVYWECLPAGEWKARAAEMAAAEAQRFAAEARVVDSVSPGEQQSEADHNFQAGNSRAGDFRNRKWRHTADWMSYDVKVLPDEPLELSCTFWGGEAGRRGFDVVVNGTIVGTERLKNNHPGEFFDASFPLPVELTRGKSQITVKFVAHPGELAGGIYGIRVLRSQNKS